MSTPAELVCYGENPKAHLCPLDRAVLRFLGDLRGVMKRIGYGARYIRRDLYRPKSTGYFAHSLQAIVGSLRRLERLGYVQRTAGAWRLAR